MLPIFFQEKKYLFREHISEIYVQLHFFVTLRVHLVAPRPRFARGCTQLRCFTDTFFSSVVSNVVLYIYKYFSDSFFSKQLFEFLYRCSMDAEYITSYFSVEPVFSLLLTIFDLVLWPTIDCGPSVPILTPSTVVLVRNVRFNLVGNWLEGMNQYSVKIKNRRKERCYVLKDRQK